MSDKPALSLSDDDSSLVTLPTATDEPGALIFVSLAVLALDVIACGMLAVHTMMCRRRFARFYENLAPSDLSLPAQFFLLSPGPIYVAGFLLAMVALILKECAIERKSFTLKVNLFVLAAAAFLYLTFLRTVHSHFEPMIEG